MLWLLAIFFLPLFGIVAYLVFEVYGKRGAGGARGAMGGATQMKAKVVQPTVQKKSIQQLEKEAAFSDTFQTRIDLADGYYAEKQYAKAIENYQLAMKGMFSDDVHGLRKLSKSYFLIEEYEEAYKSVSMLKSVTDLRGLDDHLLWAMILEKSGRTSEAEQAFENLGARNVGFRERCEYGKFLQRQGKSSEANGQFQQIIDDARHITNVERRTHKEFIQYAKNQLAGASGS